MKNLRTAILKVLKISGIALTALIALLFLAPLLFPDTVSHQIKSWTNQSIKGELNFSKSRLSFFNHFPSLTLTLYDVSLKGSAPFDKDTLLSSRKLGFGINLQKLIFDHVVHINKIFLTGGFMNVQVNEKGEANYNIYQSHSAAKKDSLTDSSAASLKLEHITFNDCRLVYNDRSIPMTIEADHLYYEGQGDLSQSIFDLASHIKTDSLSFSFDKENYITRKAIDADLITRINTQTLALIFQKNDLQLNKLALQFSGKLDFLSNGYQMDFSLSSKNADLHQLITALPPEYVAWLQHADVKGSVDLGLQLKGKYIAATKEMPDLGMSVQLRNGSIAYDQVKLPVTDLKGKAEIRLTRMDPEQLYAKLDSFSFRLDQGQFRAQWESRGLSEPEIHLNATARMDLDNLKKALGISRFDMRGQLDLEAKADGRYSTRIQKTALRKIDTIVASIPSFHLNCNIKNGTIRYPSVPEPISQLFLQLQADCPDADYHHAVFRIDTLHAVALHNYIRGKARINAAKDFPLEANLQGLIDLADIRKIYPLDSLSLAGKLRFNINTRGRYATAQQLFPRVDGQFSLEDASVQTKYYPHPIEKINIRAQASDAGGTLRDLNLSIRPASLQFEGKTFYFSGTFSRFDDLHYDLAMRGDLDIGKIYAVFAQHDLGIAGLVHVNASFKGKQSDASAGNYGQLENKGTLEVHDMRIRHEYFPMPFYIPGGRFHFEQDKMWFDQFKARYGSSDLQLDGYLHNAINYALGGTKTLKGVFNLSSHFIHVDEFMAFSGSSKAASAGVDTSAGKLAARGVVMIPANLDLTLKAEVEKIDYEGLTLEHFNGGVLISRAALVLNQTGFGLIGTQVNMSGRYAAISPVRAGFDYHLQAKDFDIHRAYQEIKLFRDLASSAEHAQGTISLDYTLSGKLDQDMKPVYPSLAGSGVLSVSKVKFNGWKLFNTVSSKTEKSDLKDPDLSKIEVKSTIKNNLITIQKMRFKTSGFRIRFEGQTSFDNKINFKMRIGLPPLGIIGIPLSITGSSDAPKIRLGKNESDSLEEKEDVE